MLSIFIILCEETKIFVKPLVLLRKPYNRV